MAAPADNTPQHFKENPYFKNKVLVKEYKLKRPWSGAQTDGVYDEMLDMSLDPGVDLDPGSCKIEWKGEDKNIVKQYPRKDDPDDEELDADFGSFFNLFEAPEDKYNVSTARRDTINAMLALLHILQTGHFLADEFFPNAILYFLDEVVCTNKFIQLLSHSKHLSGSGRHQLRLGRRRVWRERRGRNRP